MTNEEYITLISREPFPEMIEQGKGYRYIKKSVLKKELLAIYGGHTKFEIIDKAVTKNGLYGTGLFHYKHPASGEWLFETGMAAIPHREGLKLDFPLLKAQVFKNAVREIGIWFGQTLNLDIEDAEPEEGLTEEDLKANEENNREFNNVKLQLSKIKYREEAQAFLDTTNYSLTIEAKNLVNIKPLKNEKN